MSTHILTGSGIKTVSDASILVEPGVVKKATEGWICTVVDGTGIPTEWKPLFSAENIHPAFKIYAIPRTVARITGMSRDSSAGQPYNTKVIPHPVLDDHFIVVYIGNNGDLIASQNALMIRIINGITGATVSFVRMNATEYGTLFGYDANMFDQQGCTIHPFIYKAGGVWNVGVNLDVREGIAKVNEVRATGAPGGTEIADVSTRVSGYIYHGALSWRLNAAGTTLTYNGKLFDYNSNKYYLGPINQITRPTSNPSTLAQRQEFFSIGAKLYSNTDVNSSIAGVAQYQQGASNPANMTLSGVTMVTPYSGLNLHAHSKFSLMPGFRGVDYVYGFTGSTYGVRRKNMEWIPPDGVFLGRWVRLNPEGNYTQRSIDAGDVTRGLHHREQTSSAIQVVYGTDGKQYLVVATFTVIDNTRYPFYPQPHTGSANPLIMQNTNGNGVITITVYDIDRAHTAMMAPKLGTTGHPWYHIVRAHYSQRVTSAMFNRTVKTPGGSICGFKLAVEPNIKRSNTEGMEKFIISMVGLVSNRTLLTQSTVNAFVANCDFPTELPASEPSNIPVDNLAEYSVSYRIGEWTTQFSTVSGNFIDAMPKFYGMDGANFAPVDTNQGDVVSVPLRNTWSKDLPPSSLMAPGSKIGCVTFAMPTEGGLSASFVTGYPRVTAGVPDAELTLLFETINIADMDPGTPYGIDGITNTTLSYIPNGSANDRSFINWSCFSQPISDRAAEDIKNNVSFVVFAGTTANPTPAYIVSVDLNKLTDTIF